MAFLAITINYLLFAVSAKISLLIMWCHVMQVPLVMVDSIYYGKLTFPPLNIVLYNVFGGGGSSLYGNQSN